MSVDTHFALGLHTLVYLHTHGQHGPVRSEAIAASINTNASLVRRILQALHQAGLTTARKGPAGGLSLARNANHITLLEVWRAFDPAPWIRPHHTPPNPECALGRNILPALESIEQSMTRAVETALAQRTVADVAQDMRQREHALHHSNTP